MSSFKSGSKKKGFSGYYRDVKPKLTREEQLRLSEEQKAIEFDASDIQRSLDTINDAIGLYIVNPTRFEGNLSTAKDSVDEINRILNKTKDKKEINDKITNKVLKREENHLVSIKNNIEELLKETDDTPKKIMDTLTYINTNSSNFINNPKIKIQDNTNKIGKSFQEVENNLFQFLRTPEKQLLKNAEETMKNASTIFNDIKEGDIKKSTRQKIVNRHMKDIQVIQQIFNRLKQTSDGSQNTGEVLSNIGKNMNVILAEPIQEIKKIEENLG